MTVKEIKAMFIPGQKWRHVWECGKQKRDEILTVFKVRTKDIVFNTSNSSQYLGAIPKAREIRNAAPGFVWFELAMFSGNVASVTYTLEKENE